MQDRLQQAQKRLDSAMDRLEAAINTRTEAGTLGDGDMIEVATLRKQNDSLREATDTVGARLDEVIGRLRTVLEE